MIVYAATAAGSARICRNSNENNMNGTHGNLLLVSDARDAEQAGASSANLEASHRELRDLLEKRLGRRHADLLARPSIHSGSQRMEWHAALEGEPLAYRSLPPDKRAWVDAEVGDLIRDIKLLARELDASGQGELANRVRQALVHPGSDAIYLVGRQPVITFWSFGKETSHLAPAVDAARTTTARSVPRTSANDVQARMVVPWWRRPWLWLATLLPAAALLAFLLWTCGSQPEPTLIAAREGRDPSLVPSAPDSVPTRLPTAPSERIGPGVARDDIGAVDAPGVRPDGSLDPRIEGRDGAPVAPGVGDVPVPELPEVPETEGLLPTDPGTVPPDTDLDSIRPPTAPSLDTADPDGPPGPGQEPGETPAGPPPTPGDPAQDTAAGNPQPGENLEIPRDALPRGDLRFLKGRWTARSELEDDAGRKVSVEYDFDAQGRGTATIRRSDGVACNGRAVASSTATGKLRILDGGSLPCSDGSYFKPAEIVCDSSDGDAKCRGAYGSNQPFDIQIQREAR